MEGARVLVEKPLTEQENFFGLFLSEKWILWIIFYLWYIGIYLFQS